MSSPQDTTTRILKACLQLLEQDPGGVNVVRVAKAAGLSRQAIYLHFPSKAELLVATARYLDEHHKLGDRIKPIEMARDARELLETYAAFLADYNPLIYPVVRAADSARRSDRDVDAAWQDRLAQRRQGGHAIAERLSQWSRLAPNWAVPEAGDWLAAQGSVKIWEELVLDLRWTKAEYRERMARVFESTLLAT